MRRMLQETAAELTLGSVEMLRNWVASHQDQLRILDARCAKDQGATIYEIFHEINDDDFWSDLLTLEFDNYENIKKVLPGLPPETLQRNWCGTSGYTLSLQSCEFYTRTKEVFARENGKSLSTARILDFGCGWGRLLRYWSKDAPSTNLFGCDPDEEILDICREIRITATLARSDWRPKQLPFNWRFDLIYAYSVFTHLSPTVFNECLAAIGSSLESNGVVILTVRPESYLDFRGGELARLSDSQIEELRKRFERKGFAFDPHNRQPVEGEITYGEAIVSSAYIQKNWALAFDITELGAMTSDPYQVMVVLKKV
mgnify:CR=1 FL=1